MPSINKIILMGHIANLKSIETKTGTRVFTFSLSTSKKIKEEFKSMWFNIVTFGKIADYASSKFFKGDLVYVEGEIEVQKYTDDQGVEKNNMKVIAYSAKLIKSKNNIIPEVNLEQNNNDDIPF